MRAILNKKTLLNARHYEFIYSGKRYKLLSNKNEEELKFLLKKAIEYLNDQENTAGNIDTSIFIALMNSIDDKLKIEENYHFLRTKYLLCSKQNDDLSKKIASLEKRLQKTEKSINKLSQESESLSRKLSLYERLTTEAEGTYRRKLKNKSSDNVNEETPIEHYFDVDLKNNSSIKPILNRDNIRRMTVDIPAEKIYLNKDTSLFDYLIELENNN